MAGSWCKKVEKYVEMGSRVRFPPLRAAPGKGEGVVMSVNRHPGSKTLLCVEYFQGGETWFYPESLEIWRE